MTDFLQSIGIACAIFTSGFLLALGWFLGVKVAAIVFGPNVIESTVRVSSRDDISRDGDLREPQSNARQEKE